MARKCTTCGEPIQLWPTAQARADKFGGTAKDYEKIFTQHITCTTLEVYPPQMRDYIGLEGQERFYGKREWEK